MNNILYTALSLPTPAKTMAIDYGIPSVNDAADEISNGSSRYRARDFGVGYGRSSGYASDRSYTGGSAGSLFRFG